MGAQQHLAPPLGELSRPMAVTERAFQTTIYLTKFHYPIIASLHKITTENFLSLYNFTILSYSIFMELVIKSNLLFLVI